MFKRLVTLLNIVVTNPLSIPKVYRTSQERYENEKFYKYIQNQRIIWHFCSPKSASTYLMRIFEKISIINNSINILKMFRSGHNRNNIIDLDIF